MQAPTWNKKQQSIKFNRDLDPDLHVEPEIYMYVSFSSGKSQPTMVIVYFMCLVIEFHYVKG